MSAMENIGHIPGFVLREARISDIDAVTSIARAIYDQDPMHGFRYPHAGKYPQDFATCTRIRKSAHLANVQSGAYAGHVVETAIDPEDKNLTVVAYAFWEMAGSHLRTREIVYLLALADIKS